MNESIQIASIKPEISFADFEKIDIRVGTIQRVEEIEGADSVMRLIVDFGNEQRTVIAGIKQERDDPFEVQGKQALFVVNLAPRKIRGELSEAMLFDIGYTDGVTPVLAMPEASVPNGTRAG